MQANVETTVLIKAEPRVHHPVAAPVVPDDTLPPVKVDQTALVRKAGGRLAVDVEGGRSPVEGRERLIHGPRLTSCWAQAQVALDVAFNCRRDTSCSASRQAGKQGLRCKAPPPPGGTAGPKRSDLVGCAAW